MKWIVIVLLSVISLSFVAFMMGIIRAIVEEGNTLALIIPVLTILAFFVNASLLVQWSIEYSKYQRYRKSGKLMHYQLS